ncbi:sucrose-phosphate phosphatase [Pannus brasiliensis CCIBt3594]|uniref:sucrose-phosphate phosphatase n=1 Tax=Pannus brasiliensis CCIBt3594 TaxID=1427578 RepID=A0AAW9QZI1_9CHRO
MSQYLIVTDLDHTLVGDEAATREFNRCILDRREDFYLVYATGRSYGSARGLQTRENLLEPDYWIVSVGSEIYRRERRDEDWAEILSRDWNRRKVEDIAGEFSFLTPQPEEEQNTWKVSYFFSPSAEPESIERLQDALTRSEIPARVIFSSGRDVDILPVSSGKGNATEYVRERLRVPLDRSLVCGDSGNDIGLFEIGSKGAIVANARPELSRWYDERGSDGHYLARSKYAAGILEALRYFRWI